MKEYYLSTIQSVTSAQLLKFTKNFCFTVFKNFKKKKMFTLLTVVSTVLWKISLQRACIEIQTKLSNACDSGNYATLASLDLTAAFDVVDRKLLKFFWKSLGYQVNLSIFWMTGLATNLFSVKWTKTIQNFWILIFDNSGVNFGPFVVCPVYFLLKT